MIIRRNRKNGQAMVEAIVVLPILIILIWGIYRVHAVAFLGARAEMAARHAAWMASVNENEGASILDSTFNGADGVKAAKDILLNNETGMVDTIRSSTISVEPKGLWVPQGVEELTSDDDYNIVDFVNIGVDMLADILSALPVFRPFTRNAYVKIDMEIDSFGFDYFDDLEAYAYFANRWDSLYFKSIWDLLNVHFGEAVSGVTDAISEAEDAISQAEEDMEDAMEETDGEFPEDTPYTYDDFDTFLSRWRRFFSNF